MPRSIFLDAQERPTLLLSDLRRPCQEDCETQMVARKPGQENHIAQATEEMIMADKKHPGLYKRGKVWWCDFTINGERFQKSLGTTNWNEALSKKKEMEAEAQQGKLAPKAQTFGARLRFPDAADQYQAERKAHLAPRSIATEKERLKPLREYFAAAALKDISSGLIQAYIGHRKAANAANRTVNMELGILRRIMKRARLWHRVSEDIKALPERHDVGRALSYEEKVKLVKTAGSKPEWQVARLAMTLALNTTMRACEIKGLRWRDINFLDNSLIVRQSKTDAGERMIPLNERARAAIEELRERAKLFGGTQPNHYLFPSCAGINNLKGEAKGSANNPDPTRPMRDWRTAWRKLTRAAGLSGLRFHDMRHHAITELAEAEDTSEQVIMSIAGHVSRKMLEHYSHVRVDAKRKALDALVRRLGRSGQQGEGQARDVTIYVTKPEAESGTSSQVTQTVEEEWWAVQDLNLRPPACKAGALTN
jgi:integrase